MVESVAWTAIVVVPEAVSGEVVVPVSVAVAPPASTTGAGAVKTHPAGSEGDESKKVEAAQETGSLFLSVNL